MAAKRHHAKEGMKGMHAAEFYAGVDPRRRQEMMDARMLREDHSAIANLPQGVIYKEYPKVGHTAAPYLDDTIQGVDSQMNRDDMMKMKIFNPKKL